ncbi:succinate-semialdehyde dehydrogenase domain protein [Escherichia coli]|nr:succinate-semialdehyde dehydrogenase domain protein [Escherichia coli]
MAVSARQAGRARLAASIAARVSSAPIFGTLPSLSPFAGLVTSMASPLLASSHSPLINACWRNKLLSLSFIATSCFQRLLIKCGV